MVLLNWLSFKSPITTSGFSVFFTSSIIIIRSAAVRAKATSVFFQEALSIPEEVQWESQDLYHASMLEVLNLIASIPPEYKTVMIFGHNPGFTHFVNEFYGENWIDNLPTCGIVKIEGEVEEWLDFTGSTAIVVGQFFPKEVD